MQQHATNGSIQKTGYIRRLLADFIGAMSLFVLLWHWLFSGYALGVG